MHKCFYDQSFDIIDGKLTHRVVASWKNFSLEVFQRDETQTRTRNLEFNPIAGYGVYFPGEKVYGGTVALEEWTMDWNVRPYFGEEIPIAYDQEKVCRIYPDFRYIFSKCDLTYSEVMDLIPIWKAEPKVELLLANGWKNLAFSRQFLFRMRPEKRKRILRAMRDFVGENPTISEAEKIAEGFSLDNLEIYRDYRLRDVRRILTKKMADYVHNRQDDLDLREYSDYLLMVKKAGHDLGDDYWACPSDFRKQHQKVIRECNRIDKLNKERELAEKQERYEKAVHSMLGKVAEVGTIHVFVPKTCQEIQHHADKLHQCLVTADYIGKVSKGECVLVFITENGKPLATAELKPKGKKYKVGQFYGDERKRDYMAPQRAKEALNEWAKINKVKIAA